MRTCSTLNAQLDYFDVVKTSGNTFRLTDQAAQRVLAEMGYNADGGSCELYDQNGIAYEGTLHYPSMSTDTVTLTVRHHRFPSRIAA